MLTTFLFFFFLILFGWGCLSILERPYRTSEEPTMSIRVKLLTLFIVTLLLTLGWHFMFFILPHISATIETTYQILHKIGELYNGNLVK